MSKQFTMEIRKVIVVTVGAEDRESAAMSIQEDIDAGGYSQSFDWAEPQMVLLDVSYDEASELEADEALLKKHKIEVYSSDHPGMWGYTGCDADSYETCSEATEAALVSARLAEGMVETEGGSHD